MRSVHHPPTTCNFFSPRPLGSGLGLDACLALTPLPFCQLLSVSRNNRPRVCSHLITYHHPFSRLPTVQVVKLELPPPEQTKTASQKCSPSPPKACCLKERGACECVFICRDSSWKNGRLSATPGWATRRPTAPRKIRRQLPVKQERQAGRGRRPALQAGGKGTGRSNVEPPKARGKISHPTKTIKRGADHPQLPTAHKTNHPPHKTPKPHYSYLSLPPQCPSHKPQLHILLGSILWQNNNLESLSLVCLFLVRRTKTCHSFSLALRHAMPCHGRRNESIKQTIPPPAAVAEWRARQAPKKAVIGPLKGFV